MWWFYEFLRMHGLVRMGFRALHSCVGEGRLWASNTLIDTACKVRCLSLS
jgi:hypothetical protein